MSNNEFVNAIKLYVRDSAITDSIDILLDPPGRKPAKEIIEMSNWYKSMSDYDKNMLQKVLKNAVDAGLFGFLAVLDGVRVIEEESPKGNFEIYYTNETVNERLNKPEDEYLHDIFQRLVQE